MQPVDLVIADIAWLITMDAGRRVIRDAAIVVDGGKIIAVGKSADIAQALLRQAPRRWPRDGGDAGLHRLPSAFLVPAFARARRRIQCAVVPVRPHVPLRGRARGRGRAGIGDACRCRAVAARRHLLHRSRQLSSRSFGRGRDGDGDPGDRVALFFRSHQIGARHPAGAHDRNRPRSRWSVPRRCWRATPSPGIPGSAPAPRSAASTTPPMN